MITIDKCQLYNGDCLEVIKGIPDGSIDLIVADPPYFKVVNEKWDYSWSTESDYLKWCSKWIAECSRVLRLGGSLYIFGYFRMLSYVVPILESHGISIRQQIVIDKGMRAVAGRATKNYKMFPNVTESVLFCYKDPIPFSKKLLKDRQKILKLTAKDINSALGVKSNGGGMWSIYTGDNVCRQLPTREVWENLEKILDFNYDYNKLSLTYNPQMGLTDVWNDIDFYEKGRTHPTQKPIKLIDRLIKASSNPDDTVLDPFMGSGSTGVACMNTNRKFIGIELDDKYFEVARERIKNAELNKPLW